MCKEHCCINTVEMRKKCPLLLITSVIPMKSVQDLKTGIKNVKCVINDGDFIGLIGHTGSGKSTFIQHLNGLVKATSGTIYFNGMDIYDKDFDMKMLRSKVGLVFQYPEHQLFETDILKTSASDQRIWDCRNGSGTARI